MALIEPLLLLLHYAAELTLLILLDLFSRAHGGWLRGIESLN
jgi:hypothetical protein